MIIEYVTEALKRARIEKIDDQEPYYGEVPGLKGVWATGRTHDECRKRLSEVIDGWILVRLRRGLAVPPLGRCRIEPPRLLRVRG